MRVTITQPNVYSPYGILLAVGSTQTVDNAFGASLVYAGRASDTDGVLSVAPNKPYSNAPSSLTGVYTLATLPAATSVQPGTQAYTTDAQGQMVVSTGLVWSPVQTLAAQIAAQRAARIAKFNLGAAIPAPAWVSGATVVAGQCVTVPTGQVISYTTGGVVSATAPAYSKTQLSGRSIADGAGVAYGVYQQNAVTAPSPVPTMTLFASAAAAGLTETLLHSGAVADSRVTCQGGINSAAGFQNANAPFSFANGLATATTGNATASGTQAGYSATYTYNCFETALEFYVTDSVVAITFVGSTSYQSIDIDDQLMNAAPVILNGTAGQCLVFDFNGVTKRRKVCINGNTPTGSNALRGVALSTSGTIEVTDTLNDQMLLLGDSILGTISAPALLQPISYVGTLLKKYLGLSGTINCSVGGTGYISPASNGAYNCQGILANPVNQTIFPLMAPAHILIAQGYNDIGQPLAAEKAAALGVWQQARALFPSAKISITDGFNAATGPSANALSQAAALLQAFTAWGDSNSRFIQSIGASSSTAWQSGTSSNAGAIAAGNSCWTVGSDTIHPTPMGCDYLARRLAAAISAAWNGAY
jgi:hypothetical protein